MHRPTDRPLTTETKVNNEISYQTHTALIICRPHFHFFVYEQRNKSKFIKSIRKSKFFPLIFRLNYQYHRLIDASQMKDGELPASEKCALEDGEEDEEVGFFFVYW